MADESHNLILGIDIGGTSLRLALAQSAERVLSRRKVASPADQDPQVMVDTISRLVGELLAEAGGGPLAAVGVSAPGPVDSKSGTLMDPPNLIRFHTVPLRDLLRRELSAPVALENDANAAVLAEHRMGSGQGVQDMVYVTMSTGIGGGLIAGGRLITGARGGAGEIGHITIDVKGPPCGCGKNGCWEAMASGTAINKELVRRVGAGEDSVLAESVRRDPSLVDARAVHEAALQGDQLSNDILDKVAYYTGVGLGSVVNILNPELVVVGGGLTRNGDRILGPAFEICRQQIFPLHNKGLRLEVSHMGDQVALLGALVLAAELREDHCPAPKASRG
ncbi:MAG: ROK family protein [Dehalococcoidia bacterium]